MMTIVDLVATLSGPDARTDDDVIDRLSSKYTVVFLVLFSLVVSAQFVTSNPISCWTDAGLSGPQVKYAHAYCWIRNTYFLPWGENIPSAEDVVSERHIPFYQWVPLILLAQAALFYLPSCVWHGYNQRAGIDADTILHTSQKVNTSVDVAEHFDLLMIIRNQMDRFLVHRKSMKGSPDEPVVCCLSSSVAKTSSRRFGCYLILLYIFTKLLYLANVIAQLFILNSVLAVEYSVYGIEVFRWMLDNYDWTTSPQVAFPRVTMCDFVVRRLGNNHRYTVQCTLPINLYTEKIYMFLWFWMVFVAICTAISLVTWVMRMAMPRDRITYVENHLRMLQKLPQGADDDTARKFTTNYLRQDGVFLLRLIGHNTNTLTVSEIIGALWDNWKGRADNGKPPLEMKPTTEEEPMLNEKEK